MFPSEKFSQKIFLPQRKATNSEDFTNEVLFLGTNTKVLGK